MLLYQAFWDLRENEKLDQIEDESLIMFLWLEKLTDIIIEKRLGFFRKVSFDSGLFNMLNDRGLKTSSDTFLSFWKVSKDQF